VWFGKLQRHFFKFREVEHKERSATSELRVLASPPVVMAPKGKGNYRFGIDFKRLNHLSVKNSRKGTTVGKWVTAKI
jgi:hypothetical protein